MEGSDERDRAVELLADAHLVVVATGAGMSRESGIPTFREAQDGLWARYNPEELATRRGFRSNPARVWGWYTYRRRLIEGVLPHAGHRAVAQLDALIPQVVVITQNIDGLHQRAGSDMVLELHGNIHRFKCFENEHPVDLDTDAAGSPWEDGSLEPPRCPLCGSYVRPDVVWYGEALPSGVIERADTLARSCDAMLVVGTSGIVYPAAALPAAARAAGAALVEVNTQSSDLTGLVDVFLQGAAGEVLPELVEGISNRGVT